MSSDRGAFIWYELMTPDPAAAKTFYDAVVGWDIDAHNTVPDGSMDYRMINRSDGGHAGGVLGMDEAMQANGARPIWLGYVHVPDVDAAVSHMVNAGGEAHMPARDMPGVGRLAMVSDPEGAVLYLLKPTPPAGDPDATSDVFSPEKAQHVRWNELWAFDPVAEIKLYSDLFGWTQEGEMEMGPMGKYRFIHHDGVGIGAVGQAQKDGDGPRWSTFFGVDDIDRAVAAVKAGGGTVSGEPQQVPGGEYSTYCRDPHGAAFGLVGPRKEN